MMFTIEEIGRATGGVVRGNGPSGVEGVSTDSRSIHADELFVPLRGANFDGHDYIPSALAKGVRVFLADSRWAELNSPDEGSVCIVVTDTLRALGDVASFHRSRFSIPVAGVTGSNGKTTTKEMLASILVRTGKGLKTSGNLNNLIGLPQMLLRLSGEDRWAVMEMGMSEPGEIDRLAEIASPRVGIITNASPAHLETMGSIEAVAAAKGELFRRLPAGGVAVYNADDALISAQPSAPGVRRLSFGLSGGDIRASEIRNEGTAGQSFKLHVEGTSFAVMLRAFGRHNVYNAAAAAAGAWALDVDLDTIREGLEAFSPFDKRFNLEEVNGIILIDDSYNANPASMEAALLTVRDLNRPGNAIAVLGDMLELGPGSGDAHEALGRLAAQCVDRLFVTGAMAERVEAGAKQEGMAPDRILRAADRNTIFEELCRVLRRGDLVLVKGSRGMRMDEIASKLRTTEVN